MAPPSRSPVQGEQLPLCRADPGVGQTDPSSAPYLQHNLGQVIFLLWSLMCSSLTIS